MSEQDNKEHTHRVYIVTAAFMEPVSGPFRIVARDTEHAAEVLTKMIPQVKDLTIIDIVEEKDIFRPNLSDEMPDEDEDLPVDKKKLN